MKMIIGGAVAFLLGVFGIIVFSASFFDLVLAVVPVTLILAGGLMVYLNRESLVSGKKDQDSEEQTAEEETSEDDSEQASEEFDEDSDPEEPSEEPVEEQKDSEEPVPDGSNFVGNTDSKVFHALDCNFAQSKKCTDYFGTKDEAVQAGYKPCSRCNS